jgi:4-oxalomesaconate tautomerase
MMSIRCMLMRGGTSKGAYFLAEDLPQDPAARDELLLRVLGSPDPRQIDGIGGGHPLTSKVAVVGRSIIPEADVDYLFLQVPVEGTNVSAQQNCGNILAGVAGFAIERGLVTVEGDAAQVRVRMLNTHSLATLHVEIADGQPRYSGGTVVSGVPRGAAPILVEFADLTGSGPRALLPAGARTVIVAGRDVTCIDNGMPVVIARADDLGVSGYETPSELEEDADLRTRVEKLRLEAARKMGMGDVAAASIPKVCLVTVPREGGTVRTRSFIPHRVHTAIGTLAGASVAAAARMPGTVLESLVGDLTHQGAVRLEHPTGYSDVVIEVDVDSQPVRTAVVNTARKLFDGHVYPYGAEVG